MILLRRGSASPVIFHWPLLFTWITDRSKVCEGEDPQSTPTLPRGFSFILSFDDNTNYSVSSVSLHLPYLAPFPRSTPGGVEDLLDPGIPRGHDPTPARAIARRWWFRIISLRATQLPHSEEPRILTYEKFSVHAHSLICFPWFASEVLRVPSRGLLLNATSSRQDSRTTSRVKKNHDEGAAKPP